MEGLDVASALIPGLTAPMTKVAVNGTENIIDITRHSRYISPNDGKAKPHGKNDHNAEIERIKEQLNKE